MTTLDIHHSPVAKILVELLRRDFDEAYVQEKGRELAHLENFQVLEWASRKLDANRTEKLCNAIGIDEDELRTTANLVRRLGRL